MDFTIVISAGCERKIITQRSMKYFTDKSIEIKKKHLKMNASMGKMIRISHFK